MIENAAKMAGMPVGPLALNDEVGIDLSWKILQAAKNDLGANAVDPAQEKLIEALVVGHGRLGRKNGKGFYDYPGERAEEPVAWLGRRSSASGSIPTRSASRTSRTATCSRWRSRRRAACSKALSPIRARPMSARSWASATRPIPAARISFIDGMGLKAFVARAKALAAKYGPRFEPGDKLTAMAERGETFYGIYGEKQKAA